MPQATNILSKIDFFAGAMPEAVLWGRIALAIGCAGLFISLALVIANLRDQVSLKRGHRNPTQYRPPRWGPLNQSLSEFFADPEPWTAAMEATIFTGWIYDHLKPHAAAVKVAHPLMLRAIAASKKKNDRVDASKIADCLRCDFLPECYMDSLEIRERRRTLRYRSLLVRQVVQMRTRLASLLMETGVSYDRQQLHRLGFVSDLLASEDATRSIRPLLRVSQDSIQRLRRIESAMIRSLERDPFLAERVRRLQTVPCVGRITALTWALEMGDISRFRSIRQAISYCGLCGDEQKSADKTVRTPFSKKRNKHIQHVLIEAAKLAPRYDSGLALLYAREKQKGNANRATLAVARKILTYLLAVDREQREFVLAPQFSGAAA